MFILFKFVSRHITRINKRDTTDKVDVGPKVGIGSFDDLDVYSSSQVQNIPGMDSIYFRYNAVLNIIQ